jgi:hypothetical protein
MVWTFAGAALIVGTALLPAKWFAAPKRKSELTETEEPIAPAEEP